MVMRFLFGLTGSLLSGSVVAVLFTALMQYVFPDTAEYQKPPSLNVAAPRNGLTARMFGIPSSRQDPPLPRRSPRAFWNPQGHRRQIRRRGRIPSPPIMERTPGLRGCGHSRSPLRWRKRVRRAKNNSSPLRHLRTYSPQASATLKRQRHHQIVRRSKVKRRAARNQLPRCSPPGKVRNRVRLDNRKCWETSQPRRVTCLAERRREADQRGLDQ